MAKLRPALNCIRLILVKTRLCIRKMLSIKHEIIVIVDIVFVVNDIKSPIHFSLV